MNYTTSDYLEQLEQDREDLVDNLETQGISDLTGDETFTQLVPKVLDIQTGGGDASEYFSSLPAGKNSRDQVGNWYRCVKNLVAYQNSATTMQYVFANYQGEEIDLSNFNTSNITTMASAFYECPNLVTIKGLNSMSISSTCSFQTMFYYCTSIKEIDLSNIQLMNGMLTGMFNGCSSLQTINLKNASFTNTSRNLQNMFNGCSSLQLLDIRNWDFTKVGGNSGAFNGVPNNCEIIVKDETAKTWFSTNWSNLTIVKVATNNN